MRNALWLLTVLVALGIGVYVGTRWDEARLKYFEAERGLNVRFRGVDLVASYPPGTVLVSPEPLVGNPDWGWVACVPVVVGSQAEAVARGVKPILPRGLSRTGLTASFDYREQQD